MPRFKHAALIGLGAIIGILAYGWIGQMLRQRPAGA